MATRNQTTFSIDKETKKRAEVMAKKMHLTLSGVARILLNDFADGKIKITTVVMDRDENGFTAQERQELNTTIQDLKNGKNLEGPFETAEELIKNLQK